VTSVVDLVDNQDFTLLLLEDHWVWRARSVEEFQLSLANHVRAATHYQCRLPEAALAQFGIRAPTIIRGAIPLGTRPKRELLRFTLRSSESCGVYLRERRLIADDETAYLLRLFATTPAASELASIGDDLITAICSFMPGMYESFLPRARLPEWYRRRGRAEAVRRYLEAGLGFAITGPQASSWLRSCDEVGEVLSRRLEEPRDYSSASETPLLAMPVMSQPPTTAAAVTSLLGTYGTAIKAADEGEDDASKVALAVLAEYGRRWEVIVETDVPSHSNFELSIEEDRPLGLKWRGWMAQPVTLGDARSAHVVVAVSDPSVSIDDFDVENAGGQDPREVALGLLEDVRHTPETLSIYSSDGDRPYLATVKVRLRTARYIRWTSSAAALVTATAVIAVLAVGRDRDIVAKLTLLTLPTTVAATLVLVRDQTALAARLERTARVLLSLALLALWGALLLRVFQEGRMPWIDRAPHVLLREVENVWDHVLLVGSSELTRSTIVSNR
jgi:hypothetical protein